MAIVALLEVHADFLGGLHLELVHRLTGMGDIQLVVVRVAHNDSLLLSISPEIPPTSGEIVFLSVTLV